MYYMSQLAKLDWSNQLKIQHNIKLLLSLLENAKGQTKKKKCGQLRKKTLHRESKGVLVLIEV